MDLRTYVHEQTIWFYDSENNTWKVLKGLGLTPTYLPFSVITHPPCPTTRFFLNSYGKCVIFNFPEIIWTMRRSIRFHLPTFPLSQLLKFRIKNRPLSIRIIFRWRWRGKKMNAPKLIGIYIYIYICVSRFLDAFDANYTRIVIRKVKI